MSDPDPGKSDPSVIRTKKTVSGLGRMNRLSIHPDPAIQSRRRMIGMKNGKSTAGLYLHRSGEIRIHKTGNDPEKEESLPPVINDFFGGEAPVVLMQEQGWHQPRNQGSSLWFQPQRRRARISSRERVTI